MNPFQLMSLACMGGIVVWVGVRLWSQIPPEWVYVRKDRDLHIMYYDTYVNYWRPARIQEAQDLFTKGKVEEAKDIIRWINEIDRVNDLRLGEIFENHRPF